MKFNRLAGPFFINKNRLPITPCQLVALSHLKQTVLNFNQGRLTICFILACILTYFAPSELPIESLSSASLAHAADQPTTQLAPNTQSIKLNEAGVAQVKGKNFLAAEDSFKRALAADRSNLTAVYNLAGVYLQNKRTAAAIELLDAYTKETQADAGLFSRLGDAYFAAKQVDKAIQSFEKAYSTDPNYPQVITKLGTLYSLKKQLKKAEDILKDGAKRSPNDAQLLSNLSSVLYANKKTKEAITFAKRSLQINPTKELYITLGNCYLSIADKKNAKVALERARDLGDKSPELQKLLKELE